MAEFREKLKDSRAGRFVYRNSLMGIMAVTKFFENLDYVDKYDVDLPLRLTHILDTLSTSSNVAYTQISLIDEEVGEDFQRKTERIGRKINDEHLYSDEELRELCDRRDDIKLPE